jgi:hypothetical protein
MVTSKIYIDCVYSIARSIAYSIVYSIAYHLSAQLIQQAVTRTRFWPSSVTLKQKAVICSGQVQSPTMWLIILKGWSSSLGFGQVLTTLPMKSHVKKFSQCEMLPLETKQSGGKLLPHSDLWGECFSWEYHAAGNGKGTFFRYMEC